MSARRKDYIRCSYEEKYDWKKQCEILVKKMWDIRYGKNSLNFVKILISDSDTENTKDAKV